MTTVRLELDVKEVNEGALSKGGSHADKASVEITVTATRLFITGDKIGITDMADGDAPDARMHIPLASIVGSGTAADDPLALSRARKGRQLAIGGRFILSMPVLVIEKKKAKGTATISFVPDDDDMIGKRWRRRWTRH